MSSGAYRPVLAWLFVCRFSVLSLHLVALNPVGFIFSFLTASRPPKNSACVVSNVIASPREARTCRSPMPPQLETDVVDAQFAAVYERSP